MWPTPSARDWKSSNANQATMDKNARPLNETVTQGAGGQLNPTWVELLMGWPRGWTCMEPINRLEYAKWFMGFCDETKDRSSEEMQDVWAADDPQALRASIGRLGCMEAAAILLPFLREHPQETDEARLQLAGEEAPKGKVRSVRRTTEAPGAPCQQSDSGQRSREHTDALQVVSRFSAPYGPAAWRSGAWENGVPRVAADIAARVHRLKALGNGQCAIVAATAWELLTDETPPESP